MIKIWNDYIPFKGFKALTFYHLLFIRNGATLTKATLNHERIHCFQQVSCLVLYLLLTLLVDAFFKIHFWWYLLAPIVWFALYVALWLVELVLPPYRSAYRDNMFEREAYHNQDFDDYLDHWKPWYTFRYFLPWKDRK